MSRTPPLLDPWKLVWGQPYIDSRTLAGAIEQDLERNTAPDFRTRLLVRDAAVAIGAFWGPRKFAQWVAASPAGPQIRAILQEDLGQTGFPAIRKRLVDSFNLPQVRQIFEMLGRRIHGPVEVHIAGSIPTLIKGITSRPTADIVFVDEVPLEIRRQRAALRKIEAEFGLTLGHVQSRYLPANWKNRRQWLGDFGGLRVFVVEEYDIFVSKLSSKKEKHLSDLRVLALKLDKQTARSRLLADGRAFLDDPKLRPRIEKNWRFIFQQALHVEQPEKPPGEGSSSEQQPTDAAPGAGRPKRSQRRRRPRQ
jgi:Nucleotidyltransferase of unknown function (DUF6036)